MPPHLNALTRLVLLLALAAFTNGHGLVSWPRQRGALGYNDFHLEVLKSDANPDYCPHCLSGGGKANVASHARGGLWTPYEPIDSSFRFRNDHGLCGDPKGSSDHMAPHGQYFEGLTIAKYEQGDYIDMEVHVSAHHNGYFEFFVCDLTSCGDPDISHRCFRNGFCKKLIRVRHWKCESGKDRYCGPVDPKYPGRWYLPPRDQNNPTDNWYGGRTKKMRYALPKSMTCKNCVIHWAWTTANSCNPPGFAEYSWPKAWAGIPGDGGSYGGINKHFGTCGESPSQFPEELWSCSENVQILPRKGGKSRSRQIFHDGHMDIEGPQDSRNEPIPYAVPESGVVSAPEVSTQPDLPQETSGPSYSVPDLPQETSEASHSVGEERPFSVFNDTIDSDASTSYFGQQKKESRYNLTTYVSTFDTGICVKADDGNSFCKACLDLGFGFSKCMWCTKDTNGSETCLHFSPKA